MPNPLIEDRLRRIPVFALAGLMIALICCVAVLSAVPPVSKDALTHHLAVPKLYLKHGGMVELPSVPFSYYPMNLELLYLVPLYFGVDIAAKFIHFSFALFTAGLIFTYLKKRLDVLHGMLGAVFFLSLPIIVKLSMTVYVDLGLVFFTTASMMSLFKWIEDRCRIKFLIIAGVWCGLALGTKYIGLIAFLLLALCVPILYSRNASYPMSGRPAASIRAMGYGAAFILISLLVFSPWMIRNYAWTGNPVYPLYDNWFNPKVRSIPDSTAVQGADREKTRRPLGHFELRRMLYGESWGQILLVPIRIFFEGRDGNPRYFDGKLNPFLFFLPFFAFGRFRDGASLFRLEKGLLTAFAVLLLIFVFLMNDMRIRWILPMVPPLVILSIIGLHGIKKAADRAGSLKIRRAGRICLFAVIGAMLGFNTHYLVQQFQQVAPMGYISGNVGRDEYIQRYRREYPVYRFMNGNLPEQAKVLGLFLGNRMYYSDREMVFERRIFYRAVKRSDSPEAVAQYLKRQGITHLLIRYDLFDSWSNTNFTLEEKTMVRGFFEKHAVRMASKNVYGLFELNLP